jgi:glycosyltransferase involved in cell wall biosynthesis
MTEKINVMQFICARGFYGAERWILALARNLDKTKVKCDLVVTRESHEAELELTREFREKCGDTFELSMASRFDRKVVDDLCKILLERKIDILHTHGYKSDIIGVLAAKKAGIKCVMTPHGLENTSNIKMRFFLWLGCLSWKYATKVVPLSKQLFRECQKFSVPDKKLLYIQNGVDLSEVEEQKIKDNPFKSIGDNKKIGFVGQMISRKNIKDILDIFESLAGRYPNITLSLLGDGESRVELEEYTKSLAHKDRIEFLGFRDDRLELLQSFDLFVMTSSLEGIPRCLMEATAMGVPVAAYNIAGIDQLIEHEKTGLLAPYGEKELLSTYWETLLFNQEKAEQLSNAACEFVNANYSGKRMADEYVTLFNDLMY